MSIFSGGPCYGQPGACYAVYLREFYMEPHQHDRCEIMYVVSGSCTIYAGDQTLRLRERQFVFLDENLPHRLAVTPDVPCSLLNLEFFCRAEGGDTDLRSLAEDSPDFRGFLEGGQHCLLLQDSGKVGYALKDLISELERKGRKDAYLRHLLFSRMLIELSKCSARDGKSMGVVHLKKAMRFIDEHLFEELTVAAVADYVGINSAYLQTLFAGQCRCGIMAYVNNQRMENAAFLLKNSGKSIADIAYDLGYNSRQHFGYLFQRYFHMSPRQYRKLGGQAIHTSTGSVQLLADADGNFGSLAKSLTIGEKNGGT